MAPRTDSSASRFCGGSTPPRTMSRGATANGRGARSAVAWERSLGLDDHGLHGSGHARRDLDLDHVRAELADGLIEAHLAVVQLQATSLAHGVRDLLRGDGAEQAAVFAGAVL